MSVPVVQNLVDPSKYSIKCPYAMTPTRYVVHNTANDASAQNEIAYMKRNNYTTSFHYAIDDKEIVQGIPLDRNAFHASDGGNGKGNREGISIEICYSRSGGDRFIQAEKNAAEFIAEGLKQRGWGIERVTKHQDYCGKYCPHRTLDMGWQRFLNMIKSYMGESTTEPVVTPTTNPEVNKTYNVVTTLKGYYTAKDALNGTSPRTIVNPGTYYVFNTSGNAVNVSKVSGKPGSWINGTLNVVSKPASTKPSYEQAATDIINGKYGNGSARVANLKAVGFSDSEVSTIQGIVNERLTGKKSSSSSTTSTKPSYEQVATDIINGKYGNGSTRTSNLKALGFSDSEISTIQGIVNQRLTGNSTSSSSKKSLDTIAREVLQGKYGNGSTRTSKLKAAGYTDAEIKTIQSKVNALCK